MLSQKIADEARADRALIDALRNYNEARIVHQCDPDDYLKAHCYDLASREVYLCERDCRVRRLADGPELRRAVDARITAVIRRIGEGGSRAAYQWVRANFLDTATQGR